MAPRGGAREGAGRPREIEGEQRIIHVRIAESHAAELAEIQQRKKLKGDSAAVRWLIEQSARRRAKRAARKAGPA